jgi:transposase
MSKASSQPSVLSQPPHFFGADVAKAEIVIAYGGQLLSVINRRRNIQRFLATLPSGCTLALEATSTYHQLLADLAYAAGHTVYVLNPRQLKHYRSATKGRAKTDLCDALLIVRYIEREHSHLHPYALLKHTAARLCALLRRRATVVKARTLLRLSLEDHAQQLGLGSDWAALLNSYKRLLKNMDCQIVQLLQQPAYHEAASRLQSIVGIGPLSASALLVALERGAFASADAFIAFLGLDPVPRDSGQSTGRRRLSKQGDSETRRLLFNAAQSASLTALWKPLYQRYIQRGFTRIQTLCILARKLARLAWTLNQKQTKFCPQKFALALT